VYNGYFAQPPTRQDNINMINEQINRLEQMRNQINQQPNPQQQPSINQTFQLAPTTQGTMRYVNTMDDVAKEIVFGDTPFFSKDMSVLWIKNNKNEIKTYELNEIVPRDEKDLMIENLKMQLDEMNKTIKEMKDNAKPIIANDDATITSEEPASVPVSRTSKSKSK
jgi:hypothetical protein